MLDAYVGDRPIIAAVWQSLKADLAVVRERRQPFSAYIYPCVFIVVVYRLANALGRRRLTVPARALQIIGLILAGANVDWRSDLGPGVFFEHPHGVGIGDGVKVGRNAIIGQGVVLGAAHGPSGEGGFPTLGDNVQIWAKASVIGPVHVGDGAIIGAHAVVVSDVPAGTVARGVPARAYADGQLVG